MALHAHLLKSIPLLPASLTATPALTTRPAVTSAPLIACRLSPSARNTPALIYLLTTPLASSAPLTSTPLNTPLPAPRFAGNRSYRADR